MLPSSSDDPGNICAPAFGQRSLLPPAKRSGRQRRSTPTSQRPQPSPLTSLAARSHCVRETSTSIEILPSMRLDTRVVVERRLRRCCCFRLQATLRGAVAALSLGAKSRSSTDLALRKGHLPHANAAAGASAGRHSLSIASRAPRSAAGGAPRSTFGGSSMCRSLEGSSSTRTRRGATRSTCPPRSCAWSTKCRW